MDRRFLVIVLVLFSASATAAATLPTILALRGGSLTRDEVIAKLNRVPTFAIVNLEENVISLPSADGGGEYCWFIDAKEAEETLELTKAANPEKSTELLLAVTPLGLAFARCQGWADEEAAAVAAAEDDNGHAILGGTFKLCGPSETVEANAEAMREQERAQGLEPGAWCVPLYMSDDFQTPQLFPLFFSAASFHAGWARAGKPADSAPAQLTVMDLRVLVKQMEDTDAFDWNMFQFVSDPSAYALAERLIAARNAKEAEPEGNAALADGKDDEVLD
jgi:hypothetical protein